MREFMSVFGERLNGFLNYRTARGYKNNTYLRFFIKFDRWCSEEQPTEKELSQNLIHKWISDENASENEISSRITTMRLFAEYLRANGEDAYVLPKKYLSRKSRAVPHIFTNAELTALFISIDHLPSTAAEPFLNEICPVMFRLMYTCGLRPNEGRELLRENVNLDTGEILIINTKRKKDRFVVMSDDMASLARRYELRRVIFGKGNPCFFPSSKGGALTSDTVYMALNKAWSAAELDGKYSGRIRPYDLRHQFASVRLNRWLDEGENLMAMLPFLRTYMGHSSLAKTAYYIPILPENLLKPSAINWDKLNTVIPEVADDEF